MALPFHFFFAFSGLIIFAYIYLPVSETVLAEPAMMHAEMDAKAKGLPFVPANEPAPAASVDAMVAEAKRIWRERGKAGDVGFLMVNHPGDRNAYVSIYRAGNKTVSLVGEGVHFDGVTGEVLYQEPEPTLVSDINEFLTGLHLQHFEHWLLRWLYVAGGLAGCVCIATGFIFFVEKRKRNLESSSSLRWVDAFAVTAITGMLMATLAILVANRLLPLEIEHRGNWEERIFWASWLLAMLHALWRSSAVLEGRLSPAWREQSWGIAILALGAVLLNWISTGDHLIKTITEAYWPVAGVDIMLIVAALVAIKVAALLQPSTAPMASAVQKQELVG